MGKKEKTDYSIDRAIGKCTFNFYDKIFLILFEKVLDKPEPADTEKAIEDVVDVSMQLTTRVCKRYITKEKEL